MNRCTLSYTHPVEVIEKVKACLSGGCVAAPPGRLAAPKKHILIADDYVLYRKDLSRRCLRSTLGGGFRILASVHVPPAHRG